MNRDDSGKGVALVTGASSGIGAEFARQLARRGHDLVLVARREERLRTLADELKRETGVQVRVLPADLVDPAGLGKVEAELAATEDLTVLVNNAGFLQPGLFVEEPADDYTRMVQLHVTALMRLTRAALPGMVKRRRGTVINVGSIAGFVVQPQNVVYSATKAFVRNFTEGLHLELRGTGVKVQVLCPGWTETELFEHDGAGKHIPRKWRLSAPDVVSQSLRCMDKGRLFCVPGWRYRMLLWTVRMSPRTMVHWSTLRLKSLQITKHR